MTKVVIHPTGSGAQAKGNWARTIENEVDFRQPALSAALTREQRVRLAQSHPNGAARVWGTHHGNAHLVARVSPGDLVMFTAAKRLKAVARVGVVFDNASFGDLLWPRDPDRGSYRHVYTVTGTRFMDGETYDDVIRAGGFGPAYPFRNFAVLNDDRAARLLAAYGAAVPVDQALHRRSDPVVEYVPTPEADRPVSDEPDDDFDPAGPGTVDVAAHLDGFDGPTDVLVLQRARREQARLRSGLGLGREARTGRCGLCSRTFPAGLLVAAHIKRRSECSEEERRDPSVAMLACTLGCDALFEAGYISVDERGRVVTARRQMSHAGHLEQELRRLNGQPASAWSAEREKYFAWHREHRFLGQGALV